MKVVRIDWVRERHFEVVYKLKTEGNRHFYHKLMADDHMQAFVLGLEEAYQRQVELLDNKIADYQTICEVMPNADFSKEINKLRKLLTDVHKSKESDDATAK